MYQQFIRLQFHFIHKTSLIRTYIVGTNGNAKLFLEWFRKVTHAVRRNHDGQSLGLLKDQDILPYFSLAGLLAQLHQFLRQNAHHRSLKQRSANRLRQVAAEPLFPINALIIAPRIGCQRNHGSILTQPPGLRPQRMQAFYPIHLRHHVIHQNSVIMLVLCKPQTLRAAGGCMDLKLGLRKQLTHH